MMHYHSSSYQRKDFKLIVVVCGERNITPIFHDLIYISMISEKADSINLKMYLNFFCSIATHYATRLFGRRLNREVSTKSL